MKSPNNGRDRDTTEHLLSPNEASSTGLDLIESLSPNNSGRCQDCSPQTDSKSPLLKTVSTQLTEHGEVELVPTYSLHPYILTPVIQEDILHTPKREM